MKIISLQGSGQSTQLSYVYVVALVCILPPDLAYLLPSSLIHLFFQLTLALMMGHPRPPSSAANPCPRTPARLSQASCMSSPFLYERLEVLAYLTQVSIKPRTFHSQQTVRSAASITRAGMCGVAMLLGMLSRGQG